MKNSISIKKKANRFKDLPKYLLVTFVLISTVFTCFGSTQEDSHKWYQLRNLSIDGCEKCDEDELKEALNLIPGVSYTLENLADGEVKIIEYLAVKRDIPFARIDDYSILPDGEFADVRIIISEGPGTEIKHIEISGPGQHDAEEIKSIIRSKEGYSFSPEMWEEDLKILAEYYEEKGFPFARLTTKKILPEFSEISSETGTAIPLNIELEVVPGLPVKISKVEFSGLKKTKPKLARRISGIRINSPYDPVRLENARRRLLRTGWYSDVAYPGLYREYDGSYGLLFEVKEQNTNTVSGALGYVPDDNSDGGLAGFLDIYLSNLMGGGRKIHLNWKRESLEHESFLVHFSQPYIFNLPLEYHLNLSQSKVDSYYVSLEYGTGVSINLGEGWIVSSDIVGKTIHADSLAVGADSSDYRLIGYSFAAEYNHLDNPFSPGKGGRYYVTLSRQFNSGNEGPSEIRKQSVTLEEYFPVTYDWTMFTGINAQNVTTLGNEEIPVSELIRYGGAKTFRGYAEGSLLADKVGWTNFEMRRRIGGRSFAYLLFDLGVKSLADETRWNDSFGAGIQLDTGNSLLNIAVAIPGGEGLSAAVVHAVASAKF